MVIKEKNSAIIMLQLANCIYLSFYPYRFIAIRKLLVSIMFFCRAKEPKSVPASTMQACLQIVNERSRFYLKAPAHGAHQSSLPLFRNFPMGNILQSVRSLPLEAFGYFVGAAKLAQLVTLCASN